MVLRMLREICTHLDLKDTIDSKEFSALLERTDIRDLSERVDRNLRANARGNAHRLVGS